MKAKNSSSSSSSDKNRRGLRGNSDCCSYCRYPFQGVTLQFTAHGFRVAPNRRQYPKRKADAQ